MIVGFTGTREGMTPAQQAALVRYIYQLGIVDTVLHGGCVGADARFHLLVLFSLASVHTIHVHPGCDKDGNRPWAAEHLLSENEAPRKVTITFAKPILYARRNAQIVAACDGVLACPQGAQPRSRSGTWQTIGMARRAEKPCTIILPTGEVVV